jgi:hypothetical protein
MGPFSVWGPTRLSPSLFVRAFGTECVNKDKKCEVSAGHAAKAYRGSRSIAPLVLNLGTGWR